MTFKVNAEVSGINRSTVKPRNTIYTKKKYNRTSYFIGRENCTYSDQVINGLLFPRFNTTIYRDISVYASILE